MAKSKKGKFYVFEGIDGCGKATQASLLAKYLRKKGIKTETIDFPQYGKNSSAMVADYLTGKYGSSEDVGPYIASIFYATDRYDASFKIKKWLKEGKVVISDRYVVSNLGHQGGKLIKDKMQWKKYVKWLYDLEYNIFSIPKPDKVFILKTSPDFSLKLAGATKDKKKISSRKKYLGKQKQDIHEKDRKHLQNSLDSYLFAVKTFPKDFKVVECLEDGKLLAPEVIHNKIIKIIK